MHPIVRETVSAHPNLFEIVTLIKIETFESLLADHPNPAFVKSVCDGLRYGFWPWANFWQDGYPDGLVKTAKGGERINEITRSKRDGTP
jgi:hypothetical protein